MKKCYRRKGQKRSGTQHTCLIGMRLIDGVIWPSWWRLREFCSAFPMIDCELLGIFEFESAECGDGEPPFNGRLIVVAHG